MLPGQVIEGGTSSGSTVTLKQQVAGAAELSSARQQTVVVPGRKTLPEGGEQLTGTELVVQRLVAMAVKFTTAPVRAAQRTVISGGQRISVPPQITVTLKLHLFSLPTKSTAVQTTVVVPQGNLPVVDGVQVTVGLGSQLSVAVMSGM